MNLFMEQEMNWGKTEVGVVSKKFYCYEERCTLHTKKV